jgi:hypothetical protein
MGDPSYLRCFDEADSVRQLAGTWEPLVCLQFPEGLGLLYCHSCFLSYKSLVLRNVLEDTQQQQQQQQQQQMAAAGPDCQMCTIPLVDDSNVDAWKLALGLIYRFGNAVITFENAQELLLLAHKYDIRRVTGAHCLPTPHFTSPHMP